MTVQVVFLPWPQPILSPNARAHWGSLSKAKKAYREACWALAKQAGIKVPASAKPTVALTFFPPDRRRRDHDNLIAAMKSGLDGLADAMGCDDSRWRLQIEVAETIGGYVRVEVSA